MHGEKAVEGALVDVAVVLNNVVVVDEFIFVRGVVVVVDVVRGGAVAVVLYNVVVVDEFIVVRGVVVVVDVVRGGDFAVVLVVAVVFVAVRGPEGSRDSCSEARAERSERRGERRATQGQRAQWHSNA